MTNVAVPEMNILKNSSILAVSVPINLSIKLGFVTLNGQRETYFVDPLRINTGSGRMIYTFSTGHQARCSLVAKNVRVMGL